MTRFMRNFWLAAAVVSSAAWCSQSALAQRADPGHGRGMMFDGRYHHDHYYPPRGYRVAALPNGYRTVVYGHEHYYVSRGVWYRPYGPRFVVFAPPAGLVVSFLPESYTTVWLGGVPYYYANETYYLWNQQANGYVVTQPPQEVTNGAVQTAPQTEDFFVYPKRGQSADEQSRDRFECHQWAVEQTGFDPSAPGGGVSDSLNNTKRADYRRAIAACLEAREYSVK